MIGEGSHLLTHAGLEEQMGSNGLMMYGATIQYQTPGWHSTVSVTYPLLEKVTQLRLLTM